MAKSIRIQRAIETIIGAIETAAREHAAYDADPHPRKADQDEYRARIDHQRDVTIATARADLAKESATIEAIYSKTRRTSFDEAAVGSAWTRISSLLSSGRGVDDVIARDGFTRDEAEALRRNYSTFLAAQDPNLQPVAVERRTAPDLQRVLQREIALMPAAEAEATAAELERLRVGDVLRSIDKMAVEAAQSGKVSGQALLETGFAMNAAGITPPAKSWDQIVAEVDPLGAARAHFDTLDPETRARVTEAAKAQGFESSAPPEPSLRATR